MTLALAGRVGYNLDTPSMKTAFRNVLLISVLWTGSSVDTQRSVLRYTLLSYP